jgi:hypothetical protein
LKVPPPVMNSEPSAQTFKVGFGGEGETSLREIDWA